MVTPEQLENTIKLLEQAKQASKNASDCWEIFRKSKTELTRSALQAGIKTNVAEAEFEKMYDAHRIAFEASLAYVDKMEREYEAMRKEIESQ